MQETDFNTAEQNTSDISVLTEQEQEVFKLLLEGKSSNEITDILNISGGTVNYHRNNLYKKLNINSINELYNKYLSAYNGSADGSNKLKRSSPKIMLPAAVIITAACLAVIAALVLNSAMKKANTARADVVFDFWFAMGDEKGRSLVTRQMEKINGKEELVVSISGTQQLNEISYSGVYGRPDLQTLETMRSMKSISFTYMGDGGSYYISFPTIETIRYVNPYSGKDEIFGEHWLKILETKKDTVSNITINIPDDLVWLDEDRPKPDFIMKNLNCLQIQPAGMGSYNLKWWDIRLNGN